MNLVNKEYVYRKTLSSDWKCVIHYALSLQAEGTTYWLCLSLALAHISSDNRQTRHQLDGQPATWLMSKHHCTCTITNTMVRNIKTWQCHRWWLSSHQMGLLSYIVYTKINCPKIIPVGLYRGKWKLKQVIHDQESMLVPSMPDETCTTVHSYNHKVFSNFGCTNQAQIQSMVILKYHVRPQFIDF